MNKSGSKSKSQFAAALVVRNGLTVDSAVSAAVAAAPAGMSAGDPILYWNAVALEANRVSHTAPDGEQKGPVLSARALAIVHLAMYDAYAGAMGNPADLPPYQTGLPAPGAGASADVAVAAAAYVTLSELFTKQRAFFKQEWDRANPQTAGFDAGRNFGTLVAQRLLQLRKNDPGASDAGYASSTAHGMHRPDPSDPNQGFYAPFFGDHCKPFALQAAHSLDAPPAPGGAEYINALRQVRAKGVAPELMGTVPAGSGTRTTGETVIGLFWAYDGANGIGTPPRLYNQIIRQVAAKQGNSVAQNARLFALANTAMADAGIQAWRQKYVHNLWRPVLGVREHDLSFGPQAEPGEGGSADGDPEWLPYGAPKSNEVKHNSTPPFPAYPSGHATFGAAALHITRLFYGMTHHGPDDLLDGESFISDELNGITTDHRGAVRPKHSRAFDGGLWQMIEENGRSRVYLGVHWIFDAFTETQSGEIDLTRNIGGVPLGIAIAEDIFGGGQALGLKTSPLPPAAPV